MLLNRWHDLQQVRPQPASDFRDREANKLGAQLAALRPAVDHEFRTLSADGDARLQAAVECCRVALEHVENLFDPHKEIPGEEECARHSLYAELLLVPDIRLDHEGEPEEPDEVLFEALVRYPAGVEVSLECRCFRCALKRRHFAGAALVLVYLGHPLALEKRGQTTLDECREALRRDLDQTRKQVEGAVGLGLIPQEAERTKLVAKIVALELTSPESLRFADAHACLAEIREEVAACRRNEIDRIRQEFLALGIAADDPAAKRIAAALDQNDAFRATEYIQMARDKQEMPADSSATPVRVL